MNPGYWHQRASTWVSAAVLVGGMVSSLILFMLVRLQGRAEALGLVTDSPEGSQSTTSPVYLQE